jgi:hypothetical protein
MAKWKDRIEGEFTLYRDSQMGVYAVFKLVPNPNGFGFIETQTDWNTGIEGQEWAQDLAALSTDDFKKACEGFEYD